MRRKIDRDRAIESVKKWSLATTPTTELRHAMYTDVLQTIANAEGGEVKIVLPGNVVLRREPRT